MYNQQEDYEFFVDSDYGQDELCSIKEILLKLEKAVDNLEFQGSCGSATHIGSYIFKIFKSADVSTIGYGCICGRLCWIVLFYLSEHHLGNFFFSFAGR